MNIYGQTEDVIVRDMTENDLEQFLDFMKERGTNEDFTVEDVCSVWKSREEKGDLQCVIILTESGEICGFCGILKRKSNDVKVSSAVFERFSGTGYEEQARGIILSLRN